MAIEVIEQGHLPKDDVFDARCMLCRTLMRFKRSDAKFTSDQRDGDFLTVKCPTCGEDVYTSARKPLRPMR